MFAIFYPENNKRENDELEFDTIKDAIAYKRERPGKWNEIRATGKKDKAALMSNITGAIVVIREIAVE